MMNKIFLMEKLTHILRLKEAQLEEKLQKFTLYKTQNGDNRNRAGNKSIKRTAWVMEKM